MPYRWRSADRPRYALARTVVTESAGLSWQIARLTYDPGRGKTYGPEVGQLLRLLAGAPDPLTTRGLRQNAATLLEMGKDRLDAALEVCSYHRWLTITPGPRNANLHTITDTGRAHLLLAGGEAI
jgi:hypothetical protein